MCYTEVVTHQIDTNGAKLIKQRVPHHMTDEADHQACVEKKEVIEKSNSPWAAGVVFATKKDGSLSFCVDYRYLNEITVNDAYSLPKIDKTLHSWSGIEWFSTLDLYSCYWQVGVDNWMISQRLHS